MESYHKIVNFSHEEEAALEKQGKIVRNYGRLNRFAIDNLVAKGLTKTNREKVKKELLEKKRPKEWNNFLKTILGEHTKKRCNVGEVSCAGYKLTVIDCGVTEVLGKGMASTNNSFQSSKDLEILEGQEVYAPWDSTDVFWDDFELWKDLFGTSLVNLLPDRAFSLFIFCKDSVGNDTPIYYMNLEIDGSSDRHSMVWELEQVLTSVSPIGKPHGAELCSEYASCYQKLYFFMNWDEMRSRRIDRAIVSDIPKSEKSGWDEFLEDQSGMSWVDALVGIVLIAISCILSVTYQRYEISLVAGIVVAGVASEEWIAPHTILFCAIARFYANESLSLRMYYRMNISMSNKRVLISALASVGEIADVLADGITLNIGTLSSADLILIGASVVNIISLIPSATAGVYEAFSHSDFPSQGFRHFAKVYVPKDGFLRQVVEDLGPVEEYCSVYRPILHWQQGTKKRFLGNEIDLCAPGAPPGLVCYFLCTPASAAITIAAVYGEEFKFHLLPLALVEQIVAILGGIFTIITDVFITLMLCFNLLIKKTWAIGNKPVVLTLNGFALVTIFAPIHFLLGLVESWHLMTSKCLGLQTLKCRARSTARLFRFPVIERVRTGKASNHAWKFGDYNMEQYYRCSDLVIVNPRIAKIGMIGPNRLMHKRHKLLWNQTESIRPHQACLSCGDNAVSRRTSVVFGDGNDDELDDNLQIRLERAKQAKRAMQKMKKKSKEIPSGSVVPLPEFDDDDIV